MPTRMRMLTRVAIRNTLDRSRVVISRFAISRTVPKLVMTGPRCSRWAFDRRSRWALHRSRWGLHRRSRGLYTGAHDGLFTGAHDVPEQVGQRRAGAGELAHRAGRQGRVQDRLVV